MVVDLDSVPAMIRSGPKAAVALTGQTGRGAVAVANERCKGNWKEGKESRD